MIFILKLRETFLTKRFFQEFLSKPSVKTFSRGPAPPHPNSKCGFKRGNLPKTFLSKISLKTFLSKRFSQNVSLKTFLAKRFSQNLLSKLIGTQTLNNLSRRYKHRVSPTRI